jgi:Sugar-transfer associated ATP-grasp
MFELYRRDMSQATRQRFLMQASWNALSCVLNQPDRKSDDSKLALARHFTKAGIPTPRTLGYTAFAPRERDRVAPEFIPLSELARVIPPEGCVLKPDRSTWGYGVLVFKSFDRDMFEHVDGERFDTERLGAVIREQRGGFLVQERLFNHPDIAALGLPSLATLRVLTYGAGDDIRIARAALKFPVGRKGVDNYHAGGIAAPVDLESGRVGPGVDASGMEWLSSHPETGQRFEGLIVPHWNEVLTQARRAAMSMPEFRCVGWDIAVTPGGVIILEGNSVWATELVQRPHRRGIWKVISADGAWRSSENGTAARRAALAGADGPGMKGKSPCTARPSNAGTCWRRSITTDSAPGLQSRRWFGEPYFRTLKNAVRVDPSFIVTVAR